jgi:diguanylate cyclase (GGDEF)-like protein
MSDDIMRYAKNLKLLYVEDNQDAREATYIILEEYFDDIVVAVDGLDGLEKFKDNDIDIIITDINMPKMSGLEMIKEIRKTDDDIPIFIFSAYDNSSYMVESIHLHVDGYMFKPIDLKQFERVLLKTIHNVKLKEENHAYKLSLEKRVQEQVTKLREQDTLIAQQEKVANYDFLTGIYNRHKLHKIFTKESERVNRYGGKLSLMLIDIDDFKVINDTYGHEIGDSVLKEFSDIISSNIRTLDYFARWGGEEFVILLPNTSSNDACIRAEFLRKCIEAHIFSYVNNITISIGLAEYAENELLEKLIDKADKALYTAKSNGKNQVCINNETD